LKDPVINSSSRQRWGEEQANENNNGDKGHQINKREGSVFSTPALSS
jgi:hypothetical protein